MTETAGHTPEIEKIMAVGMCKKHCLKLCVNHCESWERLISSGEIPAALEALKSAGYTISAPDTAAERDRLKEVNAKLVKALDIMLMLCGRTGNSLEDFEEQAERFHAETGKMRPGKDVPSSAPWKEGTREEYNLWVDSNLAAVRESVALSLSPDSKGSDG